MSLLVSGGHFRIQFSVSMAFVCSNKLSVFSQATESETVFQLFSTAAFQSSIRHLWPFVVNQHAVVHWLKIVDYGVKPVRNGL